MRDIKLKKIIELFLLILVDIMSIYISLIISFYLRKYFIPYILKSLPPFEQRLGYYLHLYWIIPLYIFFNVYHGLYSKNRIFWEDAKEYIVSALISFVLILTIITLSKESHKISRILMIMFFLNLIIINLLFRYFIKYILSTTNYFKKRVLIVGAGKTGVLLYNSLKNDKYLGYKVDCFIDKNLNKIENKYDGIKFYKSIEEFNRYNIKNNEEIEKVFIAIPSLDSAEIMYLYNNLHRQFKEVVIIPQIRTLALTNSDIQYFFNNDLLLLSIRNNLNYKFNKFLKRVFDYLIALLLLPFLLIIVIVISILIKIDSKGPVFYRHLRYSLDGKKVEIYKFRSMFDDSDKRLKELLKKDKRLKKEWEKNYKLKNDPRITRVGKFLRKTSLDELPQIINVFKGEMSVIGPRPVVKEELEKYYSEYSEYFLNIRPGITGLWQVSGRSDTDYDFRVRSDLWYVLNWSLWIDIVILLKTIAVVFRGKGAY